MTSPRVLADDAYVRELHREYEAGGATFMELSLEHGHSEAAIRKHFRRLDLAMRPARPRKGKPYGRRIDTPDASAHLLPTARIVRASIQRMFR